MAIKVGREERQVSEGGALLMGQAPDTRAIERAQVEQAGVIGRLGEQVAFAAGKVSEVLERERQEKNTIAAGDAFNNIFAEAGQAVNEITVNATGSAAEGQTDKFRNETLPAITQKYTEGLSPDAAQELTEKMQRQQLIWQSALSSHETKQLRVAKINKDDTTLRNFTSEILNTTSNDPARGKAMLELRIADMKQEIDETGYGPEAAAQANAVAAQDLLISYYMGLDPEQALVELEQGFGNELFVSAQDQQELEKRLTIKKSQAENLAEKERRKRADSDMVDLLKLANDDKPIDLESIMNNPHFKANDIKAAQNILNWQTTRISEGVKNKQYNDTMQFIYTHPNPAAISNSDIISMLGDAKDAEHFITKRDQMIKGDGSRKSQEKLVLDSIKEDYTAGFMDSAENAELEYMRQVRDFQLWSSANPDKDPIDGYYSRLIEKNKGFLTNKLDIVQRRKDLAMERIRTKNSVVVLEDGRTIRVPEFGAWAAQMKKLNKHLTDDQIMQEYRNRYDR